MPHNLTPQDVEWQECRNTIGRLDSTIADFRKYGFTLVTGLITANAFLGQQTPGPATMIAVPAAIMMLIAVLFAVDRYYTVLLSGAVERALDIEGPTINRKHMEKNNLTQVIAVHAVRSGATYIAALLYLILLFATLGLARAMADPSKPDTQVETIYGYCFGGILIYFSYTEIVNRTGFFRRGR